jgi:hypothetical protein
VWNTDSGVNSKSLKRVESILVLMEKEL